MQKMIRSYLLTTIIAAMVCSGCVPSNDLSEIELDDDTRSLAIPLVNTVINVTDFEQETENGNVTVSADQDGRVTVVYAGEVVSRDWSIISPPLPVAVFTFKKAQDTIVILRPDGSKFIRDECVNRIEFADWNIRYQLRHDKEEDITVTFNIPQIHNNGLEYVETFTIPYEGADTTFFTSDPFPLQDYIFETVNNDFLINYDARLPNGEQIEFITANGNFQPFEASYVEGYLGKGTFPVKGNIVPVDLFSAWKSGGAVFENPRIDLYVENALGLPLAAEFDEFSIVTIANDTIPVQSQFVEEGIELAFPTLAEKGEAKITTFTFDKSNSNLKELFTERVKTVNYKINSVYNRDSVKVLDQFIGEGGYFSANVDVVIPLEGTIDELVLNDTVDISLSNYDEILKAEIKTVLTNEFPLDLDFQAYFLNATGSIIDSLYDERFVLAGADVDAQGVTMSTSPQTTFTEVDANKWQQLQSTERIAFDFKLNTKTINNSPLWVYDNYDITVKIGAILDVNIGK